MPFLFDYMDRRGSQAFSASPANEADCYLISKIGCPDLTGIVPSDEKEISLEEAVAAYRAKDGAETTALGVATSPLVLESFFRLPSVPRFRPLMLSGFRRRDNPDRTEQFSALTVRIPGGPRYITFRGTDDNIFAWKENFQMSIMNTVPAQEDALAYLLWAMDAYDGDCVVCGHSKGGNLATYASSMIPPELQDRITCIYNFDGPGFQEPFLEKEGYRRILPKLHFIIPQNSIIGLLLANGKEPEIVSCSSIGPKAHDGFTWEVLDDGFVQTDRLSHSSKVFQEAMNETLSGMDMQERARFIDDFFQIMTSTGAFTLTDLTETGLVKALEIAHSLKKDKEVHQFAVSMISNILADLQLRK